MEQFEQIRRDRDREGLSIRALAERHGAHRRAVRKALASAVPRPKRSPVSRPAPKLGVYRAVIDAVMADREAPRKQRAAKRLQQRLVDEHGAGLAEVTARRCVRARKRQLGWPVGDVLVPQVHALGEEAEVDRGQGPGVRHAGAQRAFPLRNGWQAASRARFPQLTSPGFRNSFSTLLDIVHL